MKKNLLVIFLSSILAVSCLKGGGFESSYQLAATFDRFSEEWDEIYFNGEFYGEDKAFFEGIFSEDDFVIFNCMYDEDLKDFTGFGLSRATLKDDGQNGRFSVNAESASSGDVFAIFHRSDDLDLDNHIVFVTPYGTCTPVYCMVNNTALVADMIAEYNASHETPLEVTLTATGYLDGVETGSAEILLAGPEGALDDGEDENDEDGKNGAAAGDGTQDDELPLSTGDIMGKWTRFDLGRLGNIEHITFSLSFSDESQTEIPEYFCMDDFVANVHVSIPAE